MTKLKKRAEAALESYDWTIYYHYSELTEDSFKEGYIQGATEQRAIDEDHLRKFKKMVIAWIESHFYDIENPDLYSRRSHPTEVQSMYHWSVREVVDDLRKAMEREGI